MRFSSLINAPDRALMQANRLRLTAVSRKVRTQTRVTRKRTRVDRVLTKLVERGVSRAAINVVKGKPPVATVRLPIGLGLSYNGWQSVTKAAVDGSYYAQKRLREIAGSYKNVEATFGQGKIIRDGYGRYTHVEVRLTT